VKNDTLYLVGLIFAGLLVAGGGYAVYAMTRGLRNNNPGNIRYNPSTLWAGLASPPSDGAYCVFVTPEYGIRAIALTLQNYVAVDGIPSTVTSIISRWAPPTENNTASYIADVDGQLGLIPGNDYVDLSTQLPALIAAIIAHENGIQPYSATTITSGVQMAA